MLLLYVFFIYKIQTRRKKVYHSQIKLTQSRMWFIFSKVAGTELRSPAKHMTFKCLIMYTDQ